MTSHGQCPRGGVLVKNPVSAPGPPPFKNPGSAPGLCGKTVCAVCMSTQVCKCAVKSPPREGNMST